MKSFIFCVVLFATVSSLSGCATMNCQTNVYGGDVLKGVEGIKNSRVNLYCNGK